MNSPAPSEQVRSRGRREVRTENVDLNRSVKAARISLPPGPPTTPFIGNLFEFPKRRLHLKFSEWAKIYGDVFSLKVLNQTIIVLSSPTAMHKIIDVRSTSSSNRPKSIIADMITPNNMNMGTGRFEATQLMHDFLLSPESWFDHLRRYTTSFALGIIYGKRGPTLGSQDVMDFMDVHPQFINALEIGTLPPVDLFPILTLVPEKWAKWKRTVAHIKNLHVTLYDRLLSNVERRLVQGSEERGVLMEHAIRNAEKLGLVSREHLLHLGGVLLEGSDTSSAALQNAVYALTLYQDVQSRIQRELDEVVGTNRAPIFDDLPKLKYLLAFIDECNRFRPVGPLGLPHEMTKDEIVDGYLYPKGAVLFVNIWGMGRDERYFDQPEEFNPDRFIRHPFGIKDGVVDDPARRPNMQFGGGKRVCPGIVFAKSSLELNVANLAWAFRFSPAIDDATGVELTPSLDNYSDHIQGVTATPKPYPITIWLRYSSQREIINRQMAEVQSTLDRFDED
ncbi:cytochrome P450 [Gymnopus androsaceus JB14]|uniref:Cytochrome P450 n=1 Tax=Gymnopus androsaceus JB14 TaxID=1447944 RepID=A0A6A4HMK2_9AGAR|nr:cytochrome P450 [Gymnopus androsaceus JB14]